MPPVMSKGAPIRVGRYVLFEEFARGGMASVHLARLFGEAGFSRVVAVKRVRAALSEQDEHRKSLISEARLTARIRHPNVVQTLDVVIHEGVTHVVMEYVHGVTLARLLHEAIGQGETVPPGVAVATVVDALQGLHAAHETRDASGVALGIVHRDVSPQNVQVGADGVARVLDFGIAKAMGRTQVTEPGTVKGKIAYMSREQLAGTSSVTRQTDLYAMGVVLWELLAGARLFGEDEPARLATRVLTESIPPPSTRASGVSPALDAVVMRATSADLRRRYASADEMAAELLAALPRADASEVTAWVERLAGDELEMRAEAVRRVEGASLDEIDAQVVAPRRSRRRLAVLVALALFAVTGVLGFVLLRDRPAPALRASVPTDLAAPASLATALPAPALPASTDVPVPPSPPASVPVSSAARPRPPTKRRGGACDPPYSIDGNGRKHYKPECLQ